MDDRFTVKKQIPFFFYSSEFGMTCWNGFQRIAQLLESKKPVEIREILNSYSLEQRRFLVSIKYEHSSLLFTAVKNQNMSLVTYFLESCCANPNSFGWMHGEKFTCLCAAVSLNSENLAYILLNHGANTEILCSSEGRTVLHYACENGRLEMVRLLIEHGANVNSRDYSGQTCLMESMHNLVLCKYLISVGANVNLVNYCGYTALALAFKTALNEVISFFISVESADVRLKTDFGEDVLHLAVQFSSEKIVKKIIRKGCYSRHEVIQVYETQSCLFHINNFKERSKELWEKSLRLRYEPNDATMFQNSHPTGKLQEVVHFFNDDIPAILYLESVYGSSNIFTLQAFTSAVCKIGEVDKFVVLCNYFFSIVYSLDDKHFFMTFYQAEQLIWHSLTINIVYDELNAVKVFEMIVKYVLEIRARFERMTPRERISQAYKVKLILYLVIDMIHELEWFCDKNVDSFYKGIAQILKADLRGLNQKSLLQMTVGGCESSRIVHIFLECGVNVNSTDNNGKTVLHDLVELKKESSELVKLIIDNDFDFHLVKYDEYCLPCRMERVTALPNPVKHKSLQCLAAKAFCEKAMNCFSDVPHHLLAVINSHL